MKGTGGTPTCFVYFLKPALHSEWPLTQRTIRYVTGFDCTHVAIGCGPLVLNPAYTGNEFVRTVEFLDRPDIAWAFAVPITGDLQVMITRRSFRPRSRWPSVLTYLTRGLWPNRDCVTEVCNTLRANGIAIPKRVTTPALLFDFLRGEGYDQYDYGGCTAADRNLACDAPAYRADSVAARTACGCQRCVVTLGREAAASIGGGCGQAQPDCGHPQCDPNTGTTEIADVLRPAQAAAGTAAAPDAVRADA